MDDFLDGLVYIFAFACIIVACVFLVNLANAHEQETCSDTSNIDSAYCTCCDCCDCSEGGEPNVA